MRLIDIIKQNISQLVVVFLSFTLMVLTSYFFVSGIVEKQIANRARDILLTAETTIRSDFREAEVELINMSLFAENGFKSGWTTADLQAYLTWQNSALLPAETGVPGFFNAFCYIDNVFVSGQGVWVPPRDYSPEARSWFVEAQKAAGSIGYSAPYIDKITGEKVLSLTRMMGGPDNRWYIGMDLRIDGFFDFVKSLESDEDGYGFLCDSYFTVLIHPDDGALARPLEALSSAHSQLKAELVKNPSEIIVQRITDLPIGKKVLVSKQLYNGWHLSIAIPSSHFYGDMYSMAIVLSILGFGFMNVLGILLIRLNALKARSDEENKDKTSFLARMSHEIRTPMNSILGTAELVYRKPISGEIKEYIDIIQQSGNTLLAIINDILDYSKIESNRLNIEPRSYHAASVINDIVNLIRPRAAEKSLDFFVRVDAQLPAEMRGDDMRLRQILTNLLSNAVKYTQKGFISLTVDMELLDEKRLRLLCEIKDSGIGIKKSDTKQLFAEFSRVDARHNQGIEGTGLGLVITRALCRAMGGDVTMESEYGLGSVFRASVVQEYDAQKNIALVAESERKKVIFYDDRRQYIQSLAGAFDSLGVEAENAGSFVEFLVQLEVGHYEYAFVSSRYAMECISIVGKRNAPLQLIIMVELGEASVYREVSSIMMPVYSVTLANALNGINDTTLKNSRLRVHFTAPAARILIVDDISTNLRVAKELMNPYNMNVHTCMSGEKAVEMVKNDHYDLVFMDHMMPGMDGIEATAKIRALSEDKRDLPIIALTANAVSGQREMFLENGIDDFLAKPIDVQKLNDMLEKWLPAEKCVESVRPHQQEDRHEARDAIFIPGVDVEAGIRNSGGSETAYLDILADFCRDAENRADKILAAFNSGDTKLFITHVHALKGAARSIGAMEAGDAAAALEESAAGADTETVKYKTNELLGTMRVLLNGIRAVVQKASENNETPSDLASLQLELLTAALADMNIEAVNKLLLEYASLPLDNKTRGIIAEVEELILLFEYDKAIQKMNQLF